MNVKVQKTEKNKDIDENELDIHVFLIVNKKHLLQNYCPPKIKTH